MTVLRRVLYSAVVLGVVLGALEAGARLAYGRPPVRQIFHTWDLQAGDALWTGLFRGVNATTTTAPPSRDPAQPWLVPDGEGWRRNPLKLRTRTNDVVRLQAGEPPRIVAIGGSTTTGIPGAEGAAFSDQLQALLADKAEVWNLASTGMDSEDLLSLTDEVLALKPKTVVFYEGHNDCGNAWFQRRYLSVASTRISQVDVALWNTSRAYSLLRGALEPARQRLEARRVGGLDDQAAMDLRASVLVQQQQAVAQRFGDNLSAMIAHSARAGVGFVVLVPASNLTREPHQSAHYRKLSAADQAFFDSVLGRAPRGAATPADLARAVALDPKHAMMAWYFAKSLQRAGDPLAAEWFRQARDWDVVPLRAWQTVLDSARRVAVEAKVPVVDAERLTAGPDGLADPALFFDEVHLNAEGHARIANALLPVVR